jgi:biopolymer transport protein ExbB
MQGLAEFWSASDGVGRAVALLLLAMSVASWVMILWKAWVLRRATQDIRRAVPAFWDAAGIDEGRTRLAALDRERVLLPLLDAAAARPAPGTLEDAGRLESQLTRRLRDALHRGLAHLQFGQVLLASVGSTAPFVGLFGTVWAIYHALVAVAASGSIALDQVAGPIGEALVMTAAGIAVAVPAVLAYNAYGKWVGACEAELEGFAHDLREMMVLPPGSLRSPPPGGARPGPGDPDPGPVPPGSLRSPPPRGARPGPGDPDPGRRLTSTSGGAGGGA